MTIHIRHNINISSCDGRSFSYNIICCALEFIKSLLQSRTNNIYCSTRNCICTKPNITTIPIYSVLDITAGYRILIYYVFVQYIHIYAESFDVGVFVTATAATATASPVLSWCYYFDIYEYFWNKKPKGMSGVVSVPPAVHKTSTVFSLM